ncbi:hypothetical protein BKA63DRAFT_24316 [Paraphoma chrysanthemicola]|nr:hypothetical protein BKA63DRAFT_24316 [Paraphoma chrysanthemicola]
MVDKVLLCRRHFGASIWTGSDPAVATCDYTSRHASGRLSEVTSIEDNRGGSASQVNRLKHRIGRYQFQVRRRDLAAKAVDETTCVYAELSQDSQSECSRPLTPELYGACPPSELPYPDIRGSIPELPSNSYGAHELPDSSSSNSLSMTPVPFTREAFELESPTAATNQYQQFPFEPTSVSLAQDIRARCERWYRYSALRIQHTGQAAGGDSAQSLTLQTKYQASATPDMVSEDASFTASPVSPVTPQSAAAQHPSNMSPISAPVSPNRDYLTTLNGMEFTNQHHGSTGEIARDNAKAEVKGHFEAHFPGSMPSTLTEHSNGYWRPHLGSEPPHSMYVELPGSQCGLEYPGHDFPGGFPVQTYGEPIANEANDDTFEATVGQHHAPQPLITGQYYNTVRFHPQRLGPGTEVPPTTFLAPGSSHLDPRRQSGHDLCPAERSSHGRHKFDHPAETCPICGSQFTGKYAKGNFGRHYREKHSEVPTWHGKVCRVCGKTYNRGDAKRKHEWKKHKLLDSKPHKRRTE